MADDSKKSESEVKPEIEESPAAEAQKSSPVKEAAAAGGGWGGWGFSLSYLSDLQKAAAEAAEEISRNAVEAARTAAKSISETVAEDSESSKEDDTEVSAVEEETDDEEDKRRKTALDKLEKVSEESFLSQGLKVIDTSVETFASGAWQALGTAWKGIENSATNLADSIQHGGQPGATGSVAPSLLETGKAFTAKGMLVLEQVGKETMDLLISETGILVDKKTDGNEDEDQLLEEISFDRCFYIYGGPEQLEELEALSNHYALLYNRRKAKLSSEEKSIYDGKLKEVQSIFDLGAEIDGNVAYSEKGKEKEAGNDGSMNELKKLHDSSVRKAAELAAGFASALAGLAPNDIIQRTSGRLDTIHSEGVHRLSEICCFAVTQLLMLGKSMTIISNANKPQDQEIEEETMKIDWPEDSVERAKIIRTKAQSMTDNMEAIFNGFITGISDVAESYSAAIKNASAESQGLPQKSIQEKASSFVEHLRADHSTAVGKMQDGLQYLTYLVLSTSMPAAA
ncbi:BAT2 domain protein [Perilla frutescens var. frutescens]|nr:BAT2 domain protein [Perilla frutescens var. frutescens]